MREYQILYADPPWLYNNSKSDNPAWGGKRYPQMKTEEICALPMGGLAHKDAVLFLWATRPKLPDALQVMEAWGFVYTTVVFTWVKLNPSATELVRENIYSGLGYWTNGNTECVMFGRRKGGRPKRIARNVKEVVFAPRGAHSEKPHEVRDRILRLMGSLPRIELFARQQAPGWDVWGNEVGSDIRLEDGIWRDVW